jgi:hypothetical protein
MNGSMSNKLHLLTYAVICTSAFAAQCGAQGTANKTATADFAKPVQNLGTQVPGLTATYGVTVKCPDEIWVGSVRLPQEWNMTPSTAKLKSASLLNPQVMACTYDVSVYSNPVLITRNVTPQFKSCAVSGISFVCKTS